MTRLLCATSALALFTLPAFAQDAATGVCGQPSALTQKLDQPLQPGFSDLTLMMRPERSEPGYVEFEVTEPVDLTLETMARGEDTVLTLYNAEGRMITWDDDGAGDLDARIGSTLQAGSYCVQMRLIGAEPVSAPMVVLLGAEGLPPDPYAAANEETAAICADPARTSVLAEGIRGGDAPMVNGTMDPATMMQSFRISVAEPATLQIDAMSQMFDTVLSVHGADGALMWENDDHEAMPGSDSRIREPFEPGEYCVVVKPYSDGQGAFSLSVTAEGEAQQQLSQGVRVPQAGDGVAIEELGVLEDAVLESQTLNRDQTLWTAFETDSAGAVKVEGLSVTSSFTLRLFDAEGTELQSAVSGGSVAAGAIETELEAGRYIVGLTNDDASNGMKMRQVKIRR